MVARDGASLIRLYSRAKLNSTKITNYQIINSDANELPG